MGSQKPREVSFKNSVTINQLCKDWAQGTLKLERCLVFGHLEVFAFLNSNQDSQLPIDEVECAFLSLLMKTEKIQK